MCPWVPWSRVVRVCRSREDRRRGWRWCRRLLGVLAAKQLGAEQIIAMSRHERRQRLAREFGATHIVEESGDEGVVRIKDVTSGLGAHSVLKQTAPRNR